MPPEVGTKVQCEHEWTLGDRIGGGGFGQVYSAESSDGVSAAVKLVPQQPGAERELLFVDLADVPNVVPIIDNGAYDGHWVLVMPRAELSLRDRLAQTRGAPLDLGAVVSVLCDIADALVALDGRGVVHRDLKPANVLRLDGRWCLADFGISRYAEATTSLDTQKYAWSPPYAAPERWRAERATSATDVYALGVLAFEMVAGVRPFLGPTREDFRDQHLHADPPQLNHVPSAFAALIEECLFKAPEARPQPANLRARLERAEAAAVSGGLARLSAAHRAVVQRRGESARQASEARSAAERRAELATAATRSYALISQALVDAITSQAPAAELQKRHIPGLGLGTGSGGPTDDRSGNLRQERSWPGVRCRVGGNARAPGTPYSIQLRRSQPLAVVWRHPECWRFWLVRDGIHVGADARATFVSGTVRARPWPGGLGSRSTWLRTFAGGVAVHAAGRGGTRRIHRPMGAMAR